MERIVDLDLAAAEIIARQPGWLAAGLDVGPITWRDEAAPWPQPIETNRAQVSDPDSVGVHVRGPHESELTVILYRGGWADLVYCVDIEDFGSLPTPEPASASAFGVVLDSSVARVFGKLGDEVRNQDPSSAP